MAHSSIFSFLIFFFLQKPLIVGNYSLLYSISFGFYHTPVFKTQTVLSFSLPLNGLKRKRWLVLPRENLQKKISCNFQLVVEVGAFLLLYTRRKRDKDKGNSYGYERKWKERDGREKRKQGMRRKRERRERKRREL